MGVTDIGRVPKSVTPTENRRILNAMERTDWTRPTLTVTEAAHTLGISRAAAYKAVATGDLPHIRIGGRILIPTATLARMLDLDPASPT